MFETDYLYYNGQRTGLRAGDVIRNDVGNKFTFYRNGQRMLIGAMEVAHYDDAYVHLGNSFEFLHLLAFATGLQLVEIAVSAEGEQVVPASAWYLE